MPENGDTDELLRHHNGLLDESTAVFPHVLQNYLGSFLTHRTLTLGGYSEGPRRVEEWGEDGGERGEWGSEEVGGGMPDKS